MTMMQQLNLHIHAPEMRQDYKIWWVLRLLADRGCYMANRRRFAIRIGRFDPETKQWICENFHLKYPNWEALREHKLMKHAY
jgi:hypothetical protein